MASYNDDNAEDDDDGIGLPVWLPPTWCFRRRTVWNLLAAKPSVRKQTANEQEQLQRRQQKAKQCRCPIKVYQAKACEAHFQHTRCVSPSRSRWAARHVLLQQLDRFSNSVGCVSGSASCYAVIAAVVTAHAGSTAAGEIGQSEAAAAAAPTAGWLILQLEEGTFNSGWLQASNDRTH